MEPDNDPYLTLRSLIENGSLRREDLSIETLAFVFSETEKEETSITSKVITDTGSQTVKSKDSVIMETPNRIHMRLLRIMFTRENVADLIALKQLVELGLIYEEDYIKVRDQMLERANSLKPLNLTIFAESRSERVFVDISKALVLAKTLNVIGILIGSLGAIAGFFISLNVSPLIGLSCIAQAFVLGTTLKAMSTSFVTLLRQGQQLSNFYEAPQNS